MKVTMMMAVTVDGKIARNNAHFPDWTGKEDKQLFKELTQKAGVVIMGSKTFDTIGKPLPHRKNIILTRNKNRTSEKENLVFTQKNPGEIIADLSAEGYREAILAGGARINYLFAKENLIDELLITISPIVFGEGISLLSDPFPMELTLKDFHRLGSHGILARYAVVKT